MNLKNSVPRTIREAIDSYPGGLCFSMTDGRPILANHRMNELIYQLSGHTILNAEDTWTELATLSPPDGITKITAPWAAEDPEFSQTRVGFIFPDGKIWRFRREVLPDQGISYIQLEASDITKLYHLSEELYENNKQLKRLRERQKNILLDITRINHEKELLAVKARVHDEFGRCLIATKKSLAEETLTENLPDISKAWEDAIRDLLNIPLDEPDSAASPESELLQVAEMIGCEIHFEGERPTDRSALLLLYAAVREALTNAVRHAGADVLNVKIKRERFFYHIEISDNGSAEIREVKEGTGLGNLRKRLENEGASLRIDPSRGVTLIVEIPLNSVNR